MVALAGGQAAHFADGAVDSLAAVGRQLLELVKDLARSLLLVGSEVLPGFHAVEHSLLLLRSQAGKMLQPASQTGLLLWRELPELRIVFEGAALLCWRQILIAAEPVAGVSGAVLRRMGLSGAAGVGTAFFPEIVPLTIRRVRLRLPGCFGISSMITGADCLAIVPEQLGRLIASAGRIKLLPLPFALPPYYVMQHWHERYTHDPASKWLRSVIAELFREKGLLSGDTDPGITARE